MKDLLNGIQQGYYSVSSVHKVTKIKEDIVNHNKYTFTYYEVHCLVWGVKARYYRTLRNQTRDMSFHILMHHHAENKVFTFNKRPSNLIHIVQKKHNNRLKAIRNAD